ncbi:MAG: response regulator transcription factor [Kiritimatiellae bacterium]|nr:response regulator transcription factor [Kiritimatiellia bacterium]
MQTVLIIEDDATMLRGLKDNFEYAGYRVRAASDGEAGLELAVNGAPDLIILDLMLPKINGYEVCRLVRKERLEMPIIMLTAKSDESDIVLGLSLGADDYVTKPFSIKELLARSEVLLRRRAQTEPVQYRFGDYELDLGARRLCCKGKRIDLSPKEFNLLHFFLKNPNRALTRDQILNGVWGYGCYVTPRSIDRFVTTLRGKIEANPRKPRYIQTVREIGYLFDLAEEAAAGERKKRAS